jgi:hypothetical protein
MGETTYVECNKIKVLPAQFYFINIKKEKRKKKKKKWVAAGC